MDTPTVDVNVIAVRGASMERLALVRDAKLDDALRFIGEAYRLIVTGEEQEIEIAIRRHSHGT